MCWIYICCMKLTLSAFYCLYFFFFSDWWTCVCCVPSILAIFGMLFNLIVFEDFKLIHTKDCHAERKLLQETCNEGQTIINQPAGLSGDSLHTPWLPRLILSTTKCSKQMHSVTTLAAELSQFTKIWTSCKPYLGRSGVY